MSTHKYTDKKISGERLEIIDLANQIINQFRASGYDLTLRQLYYQFIARDMLPDSWIDPVLGTKNTQKNYKRLGGVVDDGRMAGLIDWEAIVDRTREMRENPHWDSPEKIIKACAQSYQRDLWEDQDTRVSCWVEKDALIGVLEGVCDRNDVPYFSCRGFSSQSSLWLAAQTIIKHSRTYGQDTIILHLGDHDPSGIDMTRDIEDRLNIFGATPRMLEVRRIALNMDQIQSQNPPPSPAKPTDSRYKKYAEEHGDDSWELDALSPDYIDDLIQAELEDIRDDARWSAATDKMEEERNQLNRIHVMWPEVAEFVNKPRLGMGDYEKKKKDDEDDADDDDYGFDPGDFDPGNFDAGDTDGEEDDED